MPFINTRTNQHLTPAQENTLKTRLGEAISLLPGKSETWLMLAFESDVHMAFSGSNAPCAMVDVEVYGTPDSASFDNLTKKICSILSEELQIEPDRIYVAYFPTKNWGWNGQNF